MAKSISVKFNIISNKNRESVGRDWLASRFLAQPNMDYFHFLVNVIHTHKFSINAKINTNIITI